MENRVKVLNGSSATVEQTVQMLGCLPEKIAKTMSFSFKNAQGRGAGKAVFKAALDYAIEKEAKKVAVYSNHFLVLKKFQWILLITIVVTIQQS